MRDGSATFRSHQRRQRVRLQMSMAFPIGYWERPKHHIPALRLKSHTIAPPPLDFFAKCASLRERGFPFSPLATCFARVFFDNLRITASPVGSECATSDGRGWLKRGRVGLERGRVYLERGNFPGNRSL